jgi:tRNA (mo5U34)-methyltransferase
MAKSGERIAAGDRGFEERVQKLAGQVQARFRYHSIDLPDGSVLPGLQSVDHLRWRLGLFGLPNDLRGKRVLDIGAWDGWFSFECERRGAEVVAVDCVALDTFLEAKRLIGSRVEYLTLDVNELSARRLGRFDIVLFFGVLYHLRHPLLGLEKAVELSTGIALIESFVIAPEHRQHPAVMEYYERAELGGQIDNWCGPSPECLLSFCRSAGFAQAELLDITNQRASVLCTRHWPAPDAQPAAAAPQLRAAVNNRSYEAIFHPLKDEYLVCFFNSAEQNLTPDSLFVEVDGYGTQVLVIAADGSGGWQANCLRPPGLDPGRHEVRVRTLRSGHSNTAAFTMLDEFGRDVLAPAAALPMAAPAALPMAAPDALPVAAPEMCSAELRVSGDSRYAWQREGYLVCYFRSPAQTVMPGDVTIDAGGRVVQAQAISPLEPGVWQANVALNEPLAPESPVRVRLRDGEWSATAPARQRR